MLHLFVVVCGIAASQHMARLVQAALTQERISSWCWAVLVQYVICLTVLLVLDHTPLREAPGPAIGLTWFVRIFYLIKDLKKQ